MNQRIRELAKEATSTVSVNHEGYRVKRYTEQVEVFDKEKFAELIVRECVDICYNHPARMPSNNWQGITVPLDIAQRLEEHFGVEK
jgi:energy-coupling factor transporter ATP-binding protein EcfA2